MAYKHSEERGRAAIARPSERATGHSQALCRGGQLWPGPYRGDRKRPGSPPAACSPGAMLVDSQAVRATPATSTQRGDAHKGATCRHDARPPTRCRLRAGWPSTVRSPTSRVWAATAMAT
ncbi:hypothetical protein GW17_00052633 [Ensete ventricosum]|nr:hypothetical protein GW17_00052633 [Ensete ventricosum]